MNLSNIKLLILDVDGVLTDGGIFISSDGESVKRFFVRDGCAIKIWQKMGLSIAILSGRSSVALNRRATELGVDMLHCGVKDKMTAYEDILTSTGLSDVNVSYIGDDLPDLKPMLRSGFPVAVPNASPEIKRVARYITRRGGGCGGVAEVVELILRKQDRWSDGIFEGS